MTNEEKMSVLAEALETGDFTEETLLDTLTWDSMSRLTIIGAAKTAGKTITPEQLRAQKTVGDVLALL